MKARPGDLIELLPHGHHTYWHDFSAPYTDFPESESEDDEIEDLTTSDPYPFFEDPINTANITTQLGSSVNLHCKVNDLRGKTVITSPVDNRLICVFFLFFSFLISYLHSHPHRHLINATIVGVDIINIDVIPAITSPITNNIAFAVAPIHFLCLAEFPLS